MPEIALIAADHFEPTSGDFSSEGCSYMSSEIAFIAAV